VNDVIIGDKQAIYRAGVVKVLSREDGYVIAAVCPDLLQLYQAVETFQNAIIIVASTLKPDFKQLMRIKTTDRRRVIVIAENTDPFLQYTSQGANGVIFRCTTTPELVHCVRRVASGHTDVPPVGSQLAPDQDDVVGTNVRARLTTKELNIVSLVVRGMRNKEIASRLNTTEQVIKNYLFSVFNKAGVSGRLELALFTINHRALSAAAAKAAKLATPSTEFYVR
jgi:DNA-binding NarL/FixJ family response regulator